MQSTCNVHKMAVDVVKRWSHSNPDGRVIVLRLSDKQPCPGKQAFIQKLKVGSPRSKIK